LLACRQNIAEFCGTVANPRTRVLDVVDDEDRRGNEFERTATFDVVVNDANERRCCWTATAAATVRTTNALVDVDASKFRDKFRIISIWTCESD